MKMGFKKSNFTQSEKNLLIAILEEHLDIIENKKTDTTTVGLKNRAWEKVAEKYNNAHAISEKATAKQLRNLWTNIKFRRKSEMRKSKEYLLSAEGSDDVEVVNENSSHLLVDIPLTADNDFVLGVEEEDPDPLSSPTSTSLPSTSHEKIWNLNPTAHTPSASETKVSAPYKTLLTTATSDSTSDGFPNRLTREADTRKMLIDEENRLRRRKDDIVDFELQLFKEKLKVEKLKVREQEARVREAEAKADLAELILRRKQRESD